MEIDGVSLTVGGTAVTALAGVLGAWVKARFGRTRIEPQPLEVSTSKRQKYVTVDEFNRHMDDNRRDHENLFARMATTERETSKQTGLLEAILSDLQLIKGKLFGGKK